MYDPISISSCENSLPAIGIGRGPLSARIREQRSLGAPVTGLNRNKAKFCPTEQDGRTKLLKLRTVAELCK